jgi:DNA-directed RNA polymerase specialized sigma subunit
VAWYGYMVDPIDIETRFSTEDSLAYMDSIFTEPTEEDLLQIDRIREVLDHLPPREADFIELYFFRHMKQTDIANIFRVSQPTVCYRLQRATVRIRFLLDMPDVDMDELRHDMGGFLADPVDVDVMCLMYETRCQSEVAKQLGVSQGFVRHRFIRTIDRMERVGTMEDYADLFRTISANLSVLREIRRIPKDDAPIFAVD